MGQCKTNVQRHFVCVTFLQSHWKMFLQFSRCCLTLLLSQNIVIVCCDITFRFDLVTHLKKTTFYYGNPESPTWGLITCMVYKLLQTLYLSGSLVYSIHPKTMGLSMRHHTMFVLLTFKKKMVRLNDCWCLQVI